MNTIHTIICYTKVYCKPGNLLNACTIQICRHMSWGSALLSWQAFCVIGTKH